MDKALKTKSLKIQINLWIVCIVVIVMGGYAGFNYYSIKNNMDERLQSSADITAERLAQDLKEPFWALDDVILRESLASEMLDWHIYAINIYDRDGKTIYMGYKRDLDWDLVDNKADLAGDFTVRQMDIVRGEDKIGALKVYLTDRFLKAEFKSSMLAIAVIIGILIIAITLSMSLIFQKLVINPIIRITGLANRISMGDMDITIPINSDNEIGQLAKSFDRLKTSVQISMQTFGEKQLRF